MRVRVPWWSALLAATALGGGVGAAVAASGHDEYKAEAKVVVQANGGPAAVNPQLRNLRELATSSILAGNVDSTLRLPGSPDALRKRLNASIAPDSQVVVVSVTDRGHDRARQIAQEAAVVLTQLVQARFRTPPLKASVLDPAHVVSHRGRRFLRDALIGGAIGLALAVAVPLATRRDLLAAPPPTDEKLSERERELKKRIDLVTKREREVARRAGELAKRERAAAAREAEPLAPPPPPMPEPERPPAQQPMLTGPQPPPPPVTAAVAGPAPLNVNELERLVELRSEAPSERRDEWRTYLFFLREHASADGVLPASFSSLVEDVFADAMR